MPEVERDTLPELNGGGGAPPELPASGDWAGISNLAAGRTDYRSVNISGLVDSGVVNYNGTYTVLSVGPNSVTLSNPALVNANWADIVDETQYCSASLSTSGERWVGPFTCDLDGLTQVLSNFVGLSGLYSIDEKGKQRPVSVTVLVELTPVDEDDDPVGSPETFSLTLTGDDKDKSTVGKTLSANPTFTGRCRVRARRTSPTNLDFKGTLVDEVKWRDAYALAEVEQTDFGDVTTVLTRTYATSGATSVKERKLNLNATRKVPERLGDGTFGANHATERVDDIIAAICRDPYLGNYADEFIDFDNIYDTVAEIEAYFGLVEAVTFGYTFDDENVSFEETLAIVTNCVFSSAYRQGSLIRINFERAQDGGVLLFNHRNVLPGSQERTRTFGVVDDHDGIELNWTASRDGAPLTYHIPRDRSALKPRKVEVPGVRYEALAYWHAWRAWHKLVYQNVTLEQETTQEAALVIPGDRVLVTDLTRPPGFEGDILEVDGLDLRLSQPVEFAEDVEHVIFLTHIDATVEALPVGPRNPTGDDDDDYWVTLGTSPHLPIATGDGLSARPTYEVVPATDRRSRAFLISEREPNDDFTEVVRAINYSPMYYAGDRLLVWLPLLNDNLINQTPEGGVGTQSGTADLVTDSVRTKLVYEATGSGASVAFDIQSPASYTKALWVKASAGSFVDSASESFGISGSDVVAGHGSTVVSSDALETGVWQHWVVTYDADNELLRLYLNGELVDEADEVARGTQSDLRAFHNLVGRADDPRVWWVALSSEEVRALYRGTIRLDL